MNDEDLLEFSENAERNWRQYLTEFRDSVYPVFAPHGFTLPEAFLAWMMNKLNNNIGTLADSMDTPE